MLAAAAAVVIVALIVTVWLLAIAGGADAGTDRVTPGWTPRAPG
jgi:hypothetical protein